MDLEGNTSASAAPGLSARIRRSWERDSHLSWARRVRKGLKFITQLIRARSALQGCTRVGTNARVAGRLRIENHGSIVIGNHLNVNSSWVPIELVTGVEGRIQIGDEVLINFGTIIAAGSSVSIGSGSMIGPHCIISDVEIPEAIGRPDPVSALPIDIGRDVWLAGRVTIRPGVKIGDGAVVVAGSIVESDIPANFMASGIPARLLPRLGGVPRTISTARSVASPPGLAAAGVVGTEPPPRGGLIADFRLEDLVYELAAADSSPAVQGVIVPGDQLAAMLTAPPRGEAREFAVVWTTPDGAVPAFARLLRGESIDDGDLLTDVDAFCELIAQTAKHYGYVLLPTWIQPAYLRGRGLLDGRAGGILSSLAAMNLRLMHTVAQSANVFVLDAARWQAAAGPMAFNPRAWYLGRIAMAHPIVAEAARDIRAALAALRGKQRKLLVFRSDDAIWPAVAPGDTATPNGQAFGAFLQALRMLRLRGVRLALLGDSAQPDLRQAIRYLPGAALGEGDFADLGAAGGDEIEKLGALAARLGVGLDAIVYIDAREGIRSRVRTALPAVYVPDWPADKLLFPSAVLGLRCFDQGATTSEPQPRNE